MPGATTLIPDVQSAHHQCRNRPIGASQMVVPEETSLSESAYPTVSVRAHRGRQRRGAGRCAGTNDFAKALKVSEHLLVRRAAPGVAMRAFACQ